MFNTLLSIVSVFIVETSDFIFNRNEHMDHDVVMFISDRDMILLDISDKYKPRHVKYYPINIVHFDGVGAYCDLRNVKSDAIIYGVKYYIEVNNIGEYK